jgi:hypothetical protein
MNNYDSQKSLLEVRQAELSKEIYRYEELIENNGVNADVLEKLSIATKNLDKVNRQKHAIMADSVIDAEIRKLEFDADNQKYITLFALAGGFFLAYDGFTKWYNKLQKFQDRILENKVRGRKKRS